VSGHGFRYHGVDPVLANIVADASDGALRRRERRAELLFCFGGGSFFCHRECTGWMNVWYIIAHQNVIDRLLATP
jgi:hypothetical protein